MVTDYDKKLDEYKSQVNDELGMFENNVVNRVQNCLEAQTQ